jgi:hypothetical protein
MKNACIQSTISRRRTLVFVGCVAMKNACIQSTISRRRTLHMGPVKTKSFLLARIFINGIIYLVCLHDLAIMQVRRYEIVYI